MAIITCYLDSRYKNVKELNENITYELLYTTLLVSNTTKGLYSNGNPRSMAPRKVKA